MMNKIMMIIDINEDYDHNDCGFDGTGNGDNEDDDDDKQYSY